MNKDQDWKKKSNDIFKLLNDFRKNPRLLSKHLEGLKKYIDKENILTEPGKIPIQMVEGISVINEAINYLNNIKYVNPFELDPYLCQSAQEHVDDIGPKGLLCYQSSDNTEPEDRISKYGNYVEALGENIDFGPNDAIGVIVSLTLDDGEEERPHRDNLFKSDYKKIGIACGPHKTEYQMCVMDFAYDFIPREDNVNNNNNHIYHSGGYDNNNIKNKYQQPIDSNNNNPFDNRDNQVRNNNSNQNKNMNINTSSSNNNNNNNSTGGYKINIPDTSSNTYGYNNTNKNVYNNQPENKNQNK